jgi:hypothetical protein
MYIINKVLQNYAEYINIITKSLQNNVFFNAQHVCFSADGIDILLPQNINAAQIQNNLGFGICALKFGI